MGLVAIDVAILVPPPAAARAAELNRALAGGADALRLDDTHRAHVTLAQQFVERARFEDLFTELDRILRHEPALALNAPAASVDHGTIMLAVEMTPDLQRLHEQVMDAIDPFEAPDGGADAFQRDGEAIRTRDVEWVKNYRDTAAYVHYRPHVTLGHGDTAPRVTPIDFTARRIAVCQLGRFCTCRTVLREWALGGAGGT